MQRSRNVAVRELPPRPDIEYCRRGASLDLDEQRRPRDLRHECACYFADQTISSTGRGVATLPQFFARLEVMQKLRVSVDGQTRRVTGTAVAGAVPHLLRDENDVALDGIEDRQITDPVIDRSLEDEPELG
jgi:hypothetical protein